MGLVSVLWSPVMLGLKLIEKILFMLINWYDAYCYSPLQTVLSPVVAMVPRWLEIRGAKYTVFTANIVSWSRTALVIPIAWCLKYNHPVTAFLCVIFHDFLDHLDGIVAKVQKAIYGQLDDPLLGGFMDAFCDKIVNCVALWTVLVVTDFSHMSSQQTWLLVGACVLIIAYEFVLGVVRVQDYFQAFYARKYEATSTESSPNVAAVMEGKLKEKLESMGIGCLCLAQGSLNPLESVSGVIGVVCLLLSIRLAHASLEHKLKPRRKAEPSETPKPRQTSDTESIKTQSPAADKIEIGTQTDAMYKERSSFATYQRHSSVFDIPSEEEEDEKSDFSEKLIEDVAMATSLADDITKVTPRAEQTITPKILKEEASNQSTCTKTHRNRNEPTTTMSKLPRSLSVPSWSQHVAKVDKVYTVGCFDLFHEGHQILLQRIGALGRQVIVGVHDSRSIFRLKKKVPIDSTAKRMANVKKHANVVFCIRGTDPMPYLKCMYDKQEACTSMYVRGDDMPNFPGRKFIESIMPVHFLPYSDFVSSTKIRKHVYNASIFGPHVSSNDDHDHAAMFY